MGPNWSWHGQRWLCEAIIMYLTKTCQNESLSNWRVLDLHWLPVCFSAQFNILISTQKALLSGTRVSKGSPSPKWMYHWSAYSRCFCPSSSSSSTLSTSLSSSQSSSSTFSTFIILLNKKSSQSKTNERRVPCSKGSPCYYIKQCITFAMTIIFCSYTVDLKSRRHTDLSPIRMCLVIFKGLSGSFCCPLRLH